MTSSTLVFLVLGATLAAFVWGRFRYDLVALAALRARPTARPTSRGATG